MSASAVLAYRFDGKRSRLLFQVKPDSYNTQSLIAFLDELRRHFRGRRVILVWDGLPAHRSAEMTDVSAPSGLLAHGRAAARLCPGTQSRRILVGKRQRPGTRQSLRCESWRGRLCSPHWNAARAPLSATVLFLPRQGRPLFLTTMSLYYARFSKYKASQLCNRPRLRSRSSGRSNGYPAYAPRRPLR